MEKDIAFLDRGPGEGKVVSIAGDIVVFKATGEDTGGAYALMEDILPPGGGPPPHFHTREVESFYVLEGEIEFYVDGETVKGTPGKFIQVSTGTVHSFKNVSSGPAKMLILVVPSGLEKLFEEAGHAMNSSEDPAPPLTEEDIRKLIETAPRYGITIMPRGE